MKTHTTTRLIAAGAIFCSATIFSSEKLHGATFLIPDVSNWLGASAGTGISEAVLVIDWLDGQGAWAWGYRWDSTLSRTGGDLLTALVSAEPRFSVAGFDSGFFSGFTWDENLDGVPERFAGDFNPETGEYWTLSVNNEQQSGNFNDGAAPDGAHILPPLESPYDEEGPGRWVSSNTGALGVPLVDGSWNGFAYRTFDSGGPGFAVNAPAIPEPGASALFGIGAALIAVKRRRRVEK